MLITMDTCCEGQGFSRYSVTTQRRLCEIERKADIVDFRSKAKELRKTKNRIRCMAKVVAC